MKIYVASSWRNQHLTEVVQHLRFEGHDVFDFRTETGFHWSSVDPDGDWHSWSPQQRLAALDHPLAEGGFASDFLAMEWADVVILVQPCGRSAHLELGWAVGQGKKTAILLADNEPAELMYKMVDKIFIHFADLREWLRS